MLTIELKVSEQALIKVMQLVESLPKSQIKLLKKSTISSKDEAETRAFSDHTANLIEEWKDLTEDEVWK